MTMSRLGFVWVTLFLVGGTLGSAQQNTGWRSPSAHSGQFTNGSWAYSNDALYATSANGQEHRYWGYGITIPSGNEVVGIEVLVDARKDAAPPSALYVELSWDGGESWTTTGYFAGPMASAWRQYVLGGASDTWGRIWSPDEFADGTFRVRLRAVEASRLDWVAVRVYYQAEATLTLGVTPQLVDLGTLALTHYDAGYKEISPAQRITVSSGTNWSLYVAADAVVWTYFGSAPSPGKPCFHLEWRVSAFGAGVTDHQTSYRGLSTGQQKVAGGTTGTGLWLEVSLRLQVDYETTVPGTYELRFTYTLTVP